MTRDKRQETIKGIIEAKELIVQASNEYKNFANESFTCIFVVFIIGISLSTIGIFSASEDFKTFVRNYPMFKSVPLIVFLLDIVSVGIVSGISYALWYSYNHMWSETDKKIDEVNSKYIV